MTLFPRYPGTPKEFSFTTVAEWECSLKGGVEQIEALVDQLLAALGRLHACIL